MTAVSPAVSRIIDSTLRFSDVQQFVGLSLQGKTRPVAGQKIAAPVEKNIKGSRSQSHTNLPKEPAPVSLPKVRAKSETALAAPSAQLVSLPAESPQVRSKLETSAAATNAQRVNLSLGSPKAQSRSEVSPAASSAKFTSLPADSPKARSRSDASTAAPTAQLLNLPAEPHDPHGDEFHGLKAEQLAWREQLKLEERTLSDREKTERDMQKRVAKVRERRDYHKKRARQVEETIQRLTAELRAGEEAALAQEEQELQAAAAQRRRQMAMAQAVREAEAQASREAEAHASKPPAAHQDQSDDGSDDEVAPAGHSVTKHQYLTRSLSSPEASQSAPLSPLQSPGSRPSIDTADEMLAPVGRDKERTPADSRIAAGGGHSAPSSPSVAGSKQEVSKTMTTFFESELNKSITSVTSSKPPGILKKESEEPEKIVPPDPEMFASKRELTSHRRQVVRRYLLEKHNALAVFAAINLNGSGRICSQEFADGVKRLGVPWQRLTGLTKPRELFQIFDTNRSGIITFYELFPAERNKKANNTGVTTPEFWKSYVRKSHAMEKGCGAPKWQPTSPEEELKVAMEFKEKTEEAEFKHKWISTTFRRMKTRGKTDARCREMTALHLPRGTGPKDRHEVATLSKADVQIIKQKYMDAVHEPERNVLEAINGIRESRRVIQNSRHRLFTVAMEPELRKQQKASVGKQFAGLGLGMGKPKLEGDPADELPPEEPEEESASLYQLSKVTGMDLDLVEEVFRIWMRWADKTELITKKQFGNLLKDLAPKRHLTESDMNAWWDQVHRMGTSAKKVVDWTEADPDTLHEYEEFGDDDERALLAARKAPASFDRFLTWWAACELRCI